jgi:hypothetical protein
MIVFVNGKERDVTGKWIEELQNDEKLENEDPFWRVQFTRSEAIEHLLRLQKDNEDFDIEPFDFSTMSNEDLGDELCSSGMVHDTNFDSVIN